MKNSALTLSLFSSLAVHGAVLFLASIGIRHDYRLRADLISVRLLELSGTVEDMPAPPQPKTTPPPRAESPAPKSETKKVELAARGPNAADEATSRAAEAKPEIPKTDTVARAAPSARADAGGEAGAGSSVSNSDVQIATGSGAGIGGGGKELAGPGRGTGSPGLAARSAPIRTNREAKPVQTVRGSYPPMALRMGIESDVILKIEVDTEGRVTGAEITKSGGARFDEEALKAVKLARFEPTQKDGQTVPAEFTYTFRFRLQR